MKTEYGILNPIILSVYLRSNRSSVFDDMNIFREQWKLVLTGFAMSDRNNTLSRQIARTFLTKYIKQNQDLITKFDTPLSPNTVESMVFSIVQTERNILQLTWTSVT